MSLRQRLKSLSPLLMVAAVWFCAAACLMGVDMWHKGADESARARFRQIHDAESRVAVEKFNSALSEVYQDLRMLARLPGVRQVTSTPVSGDSRKTLDELFELMQSKLSVSQIVISSIQPDGKLEPCLVADAAGGVKLGSTLENLTPAMIQAMQGQAERFRNSAPTDSRIKAVDYPALGSPVVPVFPSTKRERFTQTRDGIVYSVPLFDATGLFAGTVSAVLPLSVLGDKIATPSMAVIDPARNVIVARQNSFAAQNIEYIRALSPLPRSSYNRVGMIRFTDMGSDWKYWVAAPESVYADSHDNQELERFTGLLVLFVLTVALFITLLIAASLRAREKLQEENFELERAVQARTADLLRSRRLEAIGEMAAGVAHEINTPTQFVGDNLAFLRKSLAHTINVWEDLCTRSRTDGADKIADFFRGPEAKKVLQRTQESLAAIDDSVEGVVRIRDIVRSLREFAHPGMQGRESANINRIVENAVTVTRNEWKNVARIDLRLTQSLDAANCSPGEIGQIVVNLIVNASHAIKGAGRSPDQGVIRISTGRSGDFLQIKVYDNGCGISEDHKRRVWDQHFTTKDVGVGTGMGLAIVRNIVERHHGTIELESELGCWTEFVLQLPYALPTDHAEDLGEAA